MNRRTLPLPDETCGCKDCIRREGERWDVFWVRGGRVGSFPRGSADSIKVRERFPHHDLFQTDIHRHATLQHYVGVLTWNDDDHT